MLTVEMKCLQAMPIFADIDPRRLKVIAMVGKRLGFRSGEAIVPHGTPPDAVYIVLEGEVELSHLVSGLPSSVVHRGPGAIIGDVPVLVGRPFVVGVRANTDVTMLRIERDVFLDMMRDVPQFAIAVARELAGRLAAIVEHAAVH
jgi:CRP-like cAMP-binding protein